MGSFKDPICMSLVHYFNHSTHTITLSLIPSFSVKMVKHAISPEGFRDLNVKKRGRELCWGKGRC